MNEPTRPAHPDSVTDQAPLTKPRLRPIPRWVVAVGIPAMCLVAVASGWLLISTSATSTQLDALRTAGTLGVGTGGAVALWLAVRRQRSTELDLLQKYETHQLAERVAAQNAAAADRAATHAEHDARERRLTDLYLKAVEQLGSDKAAVRHGALYALERVAQDNVGQRQTVVDVICAYLRAPYPASPVEQPTHRRVVHRSLLTASKARRTTAITRPVAFTTPVSDLSGEARQEKEVRLTAQKIISGHLWPGDLKDPDPSFWADIDLDLAGATLFDTELDGVVVGKANFAAATFVGASRFDGATFSGRTNFDDAVFTADARFVGAKFENYSSFSEAKFNNDADFAAVRFFEPATLSGITFSGMARFKGARFSGETLFDATKFSSYTEFSDARFSDDAWFAESTFSGTATFERASFTSFTSFTDAVFNTATFQEANFAGSTEFIRAHFIDSAKFDQAHFGDDQLVDFGEAKFDKAEPEALRQYLTR
ncbi:MULTISPECIES: pentapeptide repeat-containing protein [unclassified Amycolatopsis]|uniref:pentapeptide repeat-containing protein n=1 Tax=unclassified Amycolatopsis TaxID=2618356 RepID=UPI0028764191|nr:MULTISPECIES: pentapeptide repeat-containing protein [unclassified Amycolatopsis]MDS0134756.1 pentapeptide repeat-containing protein [Amycolatopsis sp. 505]MDS0148068.1 pentapeptide repeat-containing protein [Amycolatopsis sp. CM201R]